APWTVRLETTPPALIVVTRVAAVSGSVTTSARHGNSPAAGSTPVPGAKPARIAFSQYSRSDRLGKTAVRKESTLREKLSDTGSPIQDRGDSVAPPKTFGTILASRGARQRSTKKPQQAAAEDSKLCWICRGYRAGVGTSMSRCWQ